MPKYVKPFVSTLIKVAIVVCIKSAVAGGGGLTGGSTELTQLLNNTELSMQVGEAVKTNAELYSQTTMQVKQLWHDVENLKNLGAGFGQGNIDSMNREIGALTRIRDTSKKMMGDLDSFSKELSTRQVEATKSGLTMDQYVKQQARQIDGNNTRAQIRLQNEQRLMDAVTEDHKLINEWAAQVPNNAGVQQSMGLLNTQMNRAVQQLSRVSDLLNQQNDNVAKSEKLAQENADRIRDAKFSSDLRRINGEQANKMKQFRDGLGGK